MKNLRFRYHMKITFDSDIREHRFTLKCLPQNTNRQAIENMVYDVYPNRFISEDIDSFGNACIYGYCEKEHDAFYIDVTGFAKTGLCEKDEETDIQRMGYYKYQTEHTKPGPAIRAFHKQVLLDELQKNVGQQTALDLASKDSIGSQKMLRVPEDISNLDRALLYMHKLYDIFQYETGSTVIATTAEEAMAQGKGVCQDYAHILLSLCRMDAIPCRYVCGMMMGEGLSHAWVEIYDGDGWIALDPTNNLIVDDEHIKISNGRDYKDCTINQGVFIGTARQFQEASVFVEEL